jgi:3-oxoacyl-[acyl-carrier-protein] synthase III
VRTPDTYIKGLGVYLPERVSIETAVEQGLYPADQVDPLGFTGAVVAGDTPSPEMALQAARDAVKRCGQQPDEFDLMVYADTWPQGPEGWLPCSYLQHHLTGGHLLAVEIQQGCNGMFGAMQLAAGYLQGDPGRRNALLIAADNFGTPLIDRWRGGPFVLGDAASAVVLSKDDGFARLHSVGVTAIPEAEEMSRGGQPLFPPGITTGRPLDFHALQRTPDSANPDMKALMAAGMMLVHRRITELFEGALSDAGITADDIKKIAVVNNTREMVEQRQLGVLGYDIPRSTWDFGRTIGHCGASDQILALDHLLTEGELGPGDYFGMFGMAPGVILACAVIEIIAPPPWLS